MALLNFADKIVYEAVWRTYCEFDFNKYLTDSVIKMDNNIITFRVNIAPDNKIVPLEFIIDMIRSNSIITVTKTNTKKDGTILFKTIFNKFQFLSINNLLDIDYNNNVPMEIEVSYTFEDMEFINCNDLQKERAVKINKILNKGFKYPFLTRKELNIK